MVLSASGLAIVALTTRAVPSDVSPLTGRDLAALRRSIDVTTVAGRAAPDVAADAGIPLADAERVLRLLDRSTAAALALDTLGQAGIWTTTVADDDYPAGLRDRLGDAAPPVLHGAGPAVTAAPPLVGVVGSRDVTPEAAEVATATGRLAVDRGFGVVSGAARGVDALAMDAARIGGGRAVGVLADSLTRAVRSAEVRRAVLDGALTLMTPYAPGAGFSAGFAMGRNKIVYALAAHVLVVTSDLDRGGTWAGALEALAHRYSDVAVWTGRGAGAGNAALVERGARGIADVGALLDGPVLPPAHRDAGDDQLSFAV
ncbi:MAG TPA: DNA-processing protein DprA [Frankiaceae bacterium]|nr:DNA-processing protein DprA [Frankiaceae bacterium]